MPTYKCPGLHCGGCHHGDGGGGGTVRAVLAVVVVAVAVAVIRAAVPYLEAALRIAAITVTALVVLTFVVIAVRAARRVHRAVRARRAPVAPFHAEVTGVTPARRPGRPRAAELPALEPSRVFPAGWPLPAEGDPVRAGRGASDVD